MIIKNSKIEWQAIYLVRPNFPLPAWCTISSRLKGSASMEMVSGGLICWKVVLVVCHFFLGWACVGAKPGWLVGWSDGSRILCHSYPSAICIQVWFMNKIHKPLLTICVFPGHLEPQWNPIPLLLRIIQYKSRYTLCHSKLVAWFLWELRYCLCFRHCHSPWHGSPRPRYSHA